MAMIVNGVRNTRSLIALMAVMLLAPSGRLVAQDQSAKQTVTPAPPLDGLVPPRPMETVVARSTLGEFTVRDLYDYYKWFKPAIAPLVGEEKVLEMPVGWLAQLAAQLAFAKALEKEADALTDPAAKAAFRQHFLEYLLVYAIDEMKKRAVEAKIIEPSDAEVQAYYDQHKPEFFQPFQFTMRHIYLKTYEPYTVQPGDTLEAIAQKVSGDPAAVGRILSDAETRPVRWVPPEMRDKKLFKPLDPGERLLVPMRPEKAGEVKKRLEEIAAKVKAGENFEALANAYSEADSKGAAIGPLPTGVRPMVPELLEAAKATPKDGVSAVFRTKHGYNLIQITDKKEAGFKPVDQVRNGPLDTGEKGIVDVLKDRQRERLEVELNKELFALPDLKIEYETLAKAPKLPDGAVIVRVGQDEIEWSKLKSTWAKMMGDVPGTKEQTFELLRRFPPVQYVLTLAWCERHKIFQEPELGRGYAAVRAGSYSKEMYEKKIERAEAEASTDEKVAAFYAAHKEDRFRLPERVSFQTVERRAGPDYSGASERERKKILTAMKKDLAKELNKLETIDDFVDLALRSNQVAGELNPNLKPVGAPLQLKELDVGLLSGPTGDQIKKLREGAWSEPYEEEGTVRSVGVTRRIESQMRPLDEAKPDIIGQLKAPARRQAMHDIQQKILDDIKFEIVLKAGQ